MSTLVNALLGAIVWLVANVVYADMKRKGLHGFTRFAAFWVGTPTTWITLFALREGRQEGFSVEDDGGERLLAEIRRDRALRPGERAMDGEDPVAFDEAVDPTPAAGEAYGAADERGDGDEDGDRAGGGGWAPLARSRVE